ncbi:MAG: helix-turn-helix domain-containing protein, partial [Bacteroidota bacterium]
GTNVLTVDVRVVSASNKELREEVAAGRFREDLLYRLNVVTLRVPPLKERKEDIPILAEFFLQKKGKLKNPKKLTPATIDLLLAHDWPGNVRELEHVLEGAVLLSSGEDIEPTDLSIHRGERTSLTSESSTTSSLPLENISLEELERHHIERVLKKNNYNRGRTAEELGISKKTLYLKIKRYRLKVED